MCQTVPLITGAAASGCCPEKFLTDRHPSPASRSRRSRISLAAPALPADQVGPTAKVGGKRLDPSKPGSVVYGAQSSRPILFVQGLAEAPFRFGVAPWA